jgi:acyl-lipid omega-6 desaturase (Delta-12 desaturase)
MAPGADRELIAAARPFAKEVRGRSWWYLTSTFGVLLLVLAVAAMAPWWPVRAAAALLGALVLMRCFILYHDFMHGAILRNSRLARAVMYLFGLLFLAPPRSWRESHNFHHANVGKIATSGIGSFPLMSTEMWREAARWQRFRYRFIRHPLTMLSAYFTVFGFTMTLQPLLRSPRKYWDSAVSLLLHGSLVGTLWWFLSAEVAVTAVMVPVGLAMALGAYLFYAQHDFPGMRILPIEEWSQSRASLVSCSYLDLGRALRWFAGSIGYHHVHHLNAAIPFYRLVEAYNAIPELRRPPDTTLKPRDIVACLRLKLWDEKAGQMVSSYPPKAGRSQSPTSVASSQERGGAGSAS